MFCKRCRCPETPDPVDYGPNPLVIDLPDTAECNSNFRAALWTGEHLQVTLMCIPVGGDIGLEMHPDVDQFLFVVDGCGTVKMGSEKDCPAFVKNVFRNDAIFIPAGTWHNLVNTGGRPMKLSSAYAPPEHPHGTLQRNRPQAACRGSAAAPAARPETGCPQKCGAAGAAASQSGGAAKTAAVSRPDTAAGAAQAARPETGFPQKCCEAGAAVSRSDIMTGAAASQSGGAAKTAAASRPDAAAGAAVLPGGAAKAAGSRECAAGEPAQMVTAEKEDAQQPQA